MKPRKCICRQEEGTHNQAKQLTYGSADFRGDTSCLKEELLWCSIPAVYRLHFVNGDLVTTMITASYSLPDNNDFKPVEPGASVIDVAWKSVAPRFINAVKHQIQPKSRKDSMGILTGSDHLDNVSEVQRSPVLVGHDTRLIPSPIVKLLMEGVAAGG